VTRRLLTILAAIAAVTVVLLAAWLTLRVTGGDGADATELVRQARAALGTVAVRGTVRTAVRTPDGEREVRATMHRGEGRFIMRILSGPGEGTQVHRQGEAVWIEGREGGVSRRAQIGAGELDADLLARNWDFVSAGTRRVAGRTTTLVKGSGPGGGITLAVDRETGFPLHISRTDPRGRLVSETTWLDVDFSAGPPAVVKAPPEAAGGPHRRSVTLAEARAAVEFVIYEPGWVPEGWELHGWYLHESPRMTLVQARFSDGIRPLVIIQREAGHEPRLRRAGADRPDGEQRRQRMGAGRQRDGESPRRPGEGENQPRERPQRAPEHLRGAGADASRRQMDGTVVLVIGPISREERERVLDELKAP
jgi:hypothetical protein